MPDLHERSGDELPSYRPLALVAARLLSRRWLLYLGTCAAVFALQATIFTLAHAKFAGFADFYVQLIGPPLVIAVVAVFVGTDATNSLTMAQRWERVLERAWAIIVLDVGLSLIQTSGFQTMLAAPGELGNTLMGFLTLVLSAMLVYAEPFIALENEVRSLTLVPFAILRSMMLGWVNISRVFSLFAVQLAVAMTAILVHQGAVKLGVGVLWTDMAFNTLIAVPLAALFTVAYLDTLSQERQTTP